MLLEKSKFGFNIINVSTKFTECQVVLRNRLKRSSSDTKNLLAQIVMCSMMVSLLRNRLLRTLEKKRSLTLKTSYRRRVLQLGRFGEMFSRVQQKIGT